MQIIGSEVAIGDYSPEFGHVSNVEEVAHDQIRLTYVNGKQQTIKKFTELEMVQGGWAETDHTNDPEGPIHQKTR